jgi:replicative DNA helicase
MSELKLRIEEGLDGQYEGLSNGFNRINNYIFGIQRKCMTLLGGGSGSGKTTLVDFMLFNALSAAEQSNIPIDIFYYSYEIDSITKKCNILSSYIYNKYGVIITPEKIKGLGQNRLSEEEKFYIDKEIHSVEYLFSKIKFRYKSKTPEDMYSELESYALKNGDFKLIQKNIDNKIVLVKDSYVSKNPLHYKIIIVDHVALMDTSTSDGNVKYTLDKWGQCCVKLRNLYGFSIYNIQQFNDGLSSIERSKLKGVDLSPQQTDFKDSRNLYQDSDVVLGLMNPYKLDMKQCLRLDVGKFNGKLLLLKIIKNRLSKDNVGIGLYFRPEAGSFEELPKSDNFINNPDLYDKYK